MTRALLVVAGLIASVVVAVPGAASADDDPIVVSKADGTVRYVDPTLDNADTMRIVGTLSSVVRDDFDTAQAHELDPVIVTESGAVVPVDLGGASVPPGPVVAELLNGPTLEKALDGRTAGTPVGVATASVDPLPVAAAAVTPASHRIYVARLANQSGVASSAAIGSQIDAASQWWSAESGTTFSRVGAVRSVTASASSCGFANPDSVWNQVAPVFPGIDFGAGTGNHLVVVTSSSCGPTGIGTVGSTMNDGGYTLMVGTPSIFTATFAHELGHNVGLEHANRECSGCSYQNAYSVMGFAVTFGGQATVTPSLDSVYRAQLGLQDTGEITTVGPGESATITLVPRGLASGNRGVEVRTGTGVTYWVDLRTNSGRDRGSLFTLGGDVGIALSGVRYQPGVVIERQRTGAMALTYPNRATSLMDNVSGGSVRGGFWSRISFLPGRSHDQSRSDFRCILGSGRRQPKSCGAGSNAHAGVRNADDFRQGKGGSKTDRPSGDLDERDQFHLSVVCQREQDFQGQQVHVHHLQEIQRQTNPGPRHREESRI